MPVALVGLAEVIPAFVALLLVIGGALLVEFIGRSIAGSFNIPGLDFVANWVIRAQAKVIGDMSALLSNAVRGVVSFFTAPAHIIAGFLDAVVAFAWAHWTWIHDLIFNQIPSLWRALAADVSNIINFVDQSISWLDSYLSQVISSSFNYLQSLAYSLYRQAINYTTQVESYIQQWVSGLIATAEAFASQLFDQAVHFAEQLFNQAMAYIGSEIAAVEKYAADLANWAIQQAVQIATQYAKQYADWAVQQLLTMLSFGTAVALAPAYPRVLDALDAIAQAIPGTLENILEDIRAIPRVVPSSIPAAIAALLGIAAVAIEYVARCGVDLCKNLHGFGDEVGGLSDAAITAGMIAFVIMATEDPEDTAHATDSLFVEPLASVGQGFASILSLIE